MTVELPPLRERRAVHLRFTVDMIEALGWEGFYAIQDAATIAAVDAHWPDADTAAERLEWRHTSEAFRPRGMVLSTFEVMDL